MLERSPRDSPAQLRSRLGPRLKRQRRGRARRENGRVEKGTHGEEDEDVALWLRRVDLEDGRDGGMKVVGLGLRRVENVDGVSATGNCAKRLVLRERRRRRDELRKTGCQKSQREVVERGERHVQHRQSTLRTWRR